MGFRVKGLGCPKIRGTSFGVPIVRTIVFVGKLGIRLSSESTTSHQGSSDLWSSCGDIYQGVEILCIVGTQTTTSPILWSWNRVLLDGEPKNCDRKNRE